jgi:UNC-50 family
VLTLETYRSHSRYRHTAYQKQTKNQWARDDPAFVVITSVLVAVAATAYCVT